MTRGDFFILAPFSLVLRCMLVAQKWPSQWPKTRGESMARIEQRGKRWRVRVRVAGVDKSASFRTKAEAAAWAAQVQADITAGKLGRAVDKPFKDLIRRYVDEVLPAKRGERPERLRLERLTRDDDLARVRLPAFGPEHVAAWRDRRLQQVSAASVLREWATLSAACTVAIKEWRWLQINPFSQVKKPAEPAPRTRTYTDDEIDRVLLACGYAADALPATEQARVGVAVLWSLETAMRASEIVGLRWTDVDTTRRIAHLPLTKNGSARDVPLSRRALALLDQLRPVTGDGERVMGIRSAAVLDTLWRKARDRAMLVNGHFHDLRATALTRMASKLNVLELAKVSGHKDLKMLSQVYYREDPANLD
ncbi:MAG: site-specific integrase [Bradyrhizobium sp.]|nr:site-specific integrase [Bradyrhizobium sp.]